MDEDLAIKILHRVLEEKTQDTIEIQKQIATLNHQIKNFSQMHIIHQKSVVEDLIKYLNFYKINTNLNWNSWLQELKNEYFKIGE